MSSRAIPGWIYVLDDGLGFYKIGYTVNLTRRVKELGVLLPRKVRIAYAFRVPNVRLAERYFHERFASLRSHGEWFQLKPWDLVVIWRSAMYQGVREDPLTGDLVEHRLSWMWDEEVDKEATEGDATTDRGFHIVIGERRELLQAMGVKRCTCAWCPEFDDSEPTEEEQREAQEWVEEEAAYANIQTQQRIH